MGLLVDNAISMPCEMAADLKNNSEIKGQRQNLKGRTIQESN